MGKLTLDDTIIDIVSKISAGNPGCLATLVRLVKEHDEIDPEAMLGAVGMMMTFDDMEIYGTDIYILLGDKCGGDMRRFIMMMRAIQLGFLSQSKVIEMAKDQMRKINLTEEEFIALDDKVCAELVQFKKREVADECQDS